MQQHPQMWKYSLELCERQTIEVQKGANILSCQLQESKICVWGIVNPEAPTESRDFYIVATGVPITLKETARFVGTVQIAEAVLHVFELPKMKSALEI